MADGIGRRYGSLVSPTCESHLVVVDDNDEDSFFWTRHNPRGDVVKCTRRPMPDDLISHPGHAGGLPTTSKFARRS